jgi:thymidylate synthase
MDQVAYVEEMLKTDKYSRRIFMSSWNAKDLNKMALVPCHVSCQFHVDNNDGLSCHVYLRSNDLFLGNPFNAFSYAVLTYLLAARCDLAPKELIMSFGDAHIYNDHIEQVRDQLTREPHPFPRITIDAKVSRLDNIHDVDLSMIQVEDYVHHPRLSGKMSI